MYIIRLDRLFCTLLQFNSPTIKYMAKLGNIRDLLDSNAFFLKISDYSKALLSGQNMDINFFF